MKGSAVGFVFSDYDGTLAPADVPRSDSAIRRELEPVLQEIARTSRLAIITAKDFEFISARVPFAAAWGCVFGTDLRFADGSRITFSSETDVEGALKVAKEVLADRVTFEEKRSASRLLGFSADWRGSERPPQMSSLLATLLGRGLHACYDPESPFIDFISVPPMKGRALRFINAVERSDGATVYLGDSSSDNCAFQAADISVGVDHGQAIDGLNCQYVATAESLTDFLRALADQGMQFDPGLPGLRRK